MLFKQQALLRQKLFVLGSLAIGSLLYLVARVGSLDRSSEDPLNRWQSALQSTPVLHLSEKSKVSQPESISHRRSTVKTPGLQPICPIDDRLRPHGQDEIPLRALQFKRGLLHEFRKGNATKEQIRLHNLVQLFSSSLRPLKLGVLLASKKLAYGNSESDYKIGLHLHYYDERCKRLAQEGSLRDKHHKHVKEIEWVKVRPFVLQTTTVCLAKVCSTRSNHMMWWLSNCHNHRRVSEVPKFDRFALLYIVLPSGSMVPG
ncbi:Heparan sulfate glucosamine 3-O-sulfotransferase 5 [Chelonia mydas]|uniref:Heparan sulfate glucosamine 3-O-sulfotransferase 5 n=1 Tax=Chelonia mydas TaxID=8469 RepID=M7CBI2_CHEMY|nr:Heparan sulfate glucosamine 3-O-sulfotransferase 5 [Chelonia mydas]